MGTISPEDVVRSICSNPDCRLIRLSESKSAPYAWHIVEHVTKGDDGYTCPFNHEKGPYVTKGRQTLIIHLRSQHTHEVSSCPMEFCSFESTDPARISKHLRHEHSVVTSRKNRMRLPRSSRSRTRSMSRAPMPSPPSIPQEGVPSIEYYQPMDPPTGQPGMGNQEPLSSPPSIASIPTLSFATRNFHSSPPFAPGQSYSSLDVNYVYTNVAGNSPQAQEVRDAYIAAMWRTFGDLSFHAPSDLGLEEEFYGGMAHNQ